MPLSQLLVLLSSDPVLVLLPAGSCGVTIALVIDPFVKDSSRPAPCTVFSTACSSVSVC